jgi:HEAT repeat protein
VAGIATVTLLVLMTATVILGVVIVFGRAMRRIRDARRTRLAAPGRRVLLAVAAGDAQPENQQTLVRLEPASWRAVEPSAVALLGKVRGEAHAALVSVFEQRGMGDRALRELRGRNALRRARAAEVLGNLGRRDAVPALVTLLADPDPDVRGVAARALGRIADPAAAAALLRSLAGRRPVPPQIVAHAVMRMGAGAQDALTAALDHDADLVRATAIEVLGLVGAITADSRVIETLRTDPSLDVRERAAATLGRLGTRSALPPLLEAVEPNHARKLRAVATRALGDLAAVAAAPALGALLSDPQHEVAHAAAHSLLRLGPSGRDVLEHAVAAGPDASMGRHAAPRTVPVEDAPARAAAYAWEALALAEVDERRRVHALVGGR